MKQSGLCGKTRHEYIPVDSGAAVPAAHGLPAETALPMVKCVVHFCSVLQVLTFFNAAETGMITGLSYNACKIAGESDAVCRYPELYQM